MILFACGWEAGPNERGGSIPDIGFVLQDVWEGAPITDGSERQDDDRNGDDVGGNGRFAFRPLPDVAALAIFNGHIIARSGTTIWWSHRVKVEGFQLPGNLETSQYYHIARLGVAWAGTYPQLALAISILDSTHFAFCIRRSDAEGDWVQTIAESTNRTWPTDHLWVQVELNTSTLALKLFVDDGEGSVKVAEGTLGAAPGDNGCILPYSWHEGSKGNSAAMNIILSDVMSNDSESPTPFGKPSSLYQTILYQADGDVDGFSQWAGTPDINNKHRNWDDKNDLSDEYLDRNTPGASNLDQISTHKDSTGVNPFTVRSVRVLLSEYQTIKARVTEGDWQTYTPITGGNPDLAAPWSGWQLVNAPSGNAWGTLNFDAMKAGCRSLGTAPVHEFYLIATGENLERPAKSPVPEAGVPCSLIVVAQVI